MDEGARHRRKLPKDAHRFAAEVEERSKGVMSEVRGRHTPARLSRNQIGVSRAKHALSKFEGGAKEKRVVISIPSAILRAGSGRNPCFEQSEKSSSHIPRIRQTV